MRIYKKYGDASISVVKNEPYRLAADVWGIGFLTADRIAQAVGIPHEGVEFGRGQIVASLSVVAPTVRSNVCTSPDCVAG